MDPSLKMSSSIESLVSEIKKEVFSELENNIQSFVSPSAYDTAWLAYIPDGGGCDYQPEGPMFKNCLKWILENQREEGFWGETINEADLPTIDSLPATLACLIALKKWNVGYDHIEKGLAFIHSKAEILLKINHPNLPRWFLLVFPAMIKLTEDIGLDLNFSAGLKEIVADMFFKRDQLLDAELVEDSKYFPPLLSYLETLPSTHHRFQQQKWICVEKCMNNDGSLFQSPSAMAYAFMATSNPKSLKYLRSILQKFPNGGVPAKYPVDEDLIKLSLVDYVQRLGLADHFNHEIEKILTQVYRNRNMCKSYKKETNMVPMKLFKDALAFRLLRMQGNCVNPGSFCWFVHDPEILTYMKENCDEFVSAMYSVYRATDLQFPGESELEEARKFATKMLQNSNTRNTDHNLVISKGLQKLIKQELDVQWTARLERLNHRKWIEESITGPLWIGKASFYRLPFLDNKKLLQLAVENFEFQQLVYGNELEELKRWSKKWGLSEMGFGREKTIYTYYAVSATSCLPLNSIMRLVIAKSAIIVTVADDFYDEEGSLSELEALTEAVKRWDGEGLRGHANTIFQALDDFVNDIAVKTHHPHERNLVISQLRDIWRETFMAWMVERTWSLTGYIPSMDEYLETGMISIAAHAIALPATTFFSQTSTNGTSNHVEYRNITKLLMTITRLLNDTQSYQKEQGQGKMNLVLLHSNENPSASIEDSVAYVKEILDGKTKEFLKHVFAEDEFDDEDNYEMSRSCKHVHLSCMRVFNMFFNSANLFDSKTALLDDIQKAIYLPIGHSRRLKPDLLPSPVPSSNKNHKISKISTGFQTMVQHMETKRPIRQPFISKNLSATGSEKMGILPRFNACFI